MHVWIGDARVQWSTRGSEETYSLGILFFADVGKTQDQMQQGPRSPASHGWASCQRRLLPARTNN